MITKVAPSNTLCHGPGRVKPGRKIVAGVPAAVILFGLHINHFSIDSDFAFPGVIDR